MVFERLNKRVFRWWKKGCFHSVLLWKKVASTVFPKNASQRLKVWTVQVGKVFVEFFNGDKNGSFNGEKKEVSRKFF